MWPALNCGPYPMDCTFSDSVSLPVLISGIFRKDCRFRKAWNSRASGFDAYLPRCAVEATLPSLISLPWRVGEAVSGSEATSSSAGFHEWRNCQTILSLEGNAGCLMDGLSPDPSGRGLQTCREGGVPVAGTRGGEPCDESAVCRSPAADRAFWIRASTTLLLEQE